MIYIVVPTKLILMKICISTIILILTSFLNTSFSQDDDSFKPGGKPVFQMFNDVRHSFSSDGSNTAFELTRLYLGYEYSFSRSLSSRAVFDIGDPGTGGLQMTAYVKNAYLQYRSNGLTVRAGMIPTDQFNLIDRQWGYRYIAKTFQDEYGLGPSADLGAGIEYAPSNFISLDASVLNGEGFRRIQSDSALKYTMGVTIRPVEGLVIRGYTDFMKKEFTQNTISLFAGYRMGAVNTGLEYSMQANNRMIRDRDFSGIMAFASIKVAEKYSVFARYDNLWSETITGDIDPWNYNRDGQLLMTGLEYSPVQGVRIAPSYRGWLPANDNLNFMSSAGIFLELRF